jgi:vacuolar-type H+-ATPase subunit E/Vma4
VNPLEKEQVVQRLINDIEIQAEDSLKSLQWDAESQRGSILTSIRKKAEEEAALYKEQELVDLRSNLIQNESQAKWKVKHDLLKRRAQLVDGLFEDVRHDLSAFVKSDAYDVFQGEMLEKLSRREDIGHASLIVKEDEVQRFAKILHSLKLDFPVSTGEHIHIGGFILVSESGRLEIDQTLDTQLHSQREWFFNHSKLVL